MTQCFKKCLWLSTVLLAILHQSVSSVFAAEPHSGVESVFRELKQNTAEKSYEIQIAKSTFEQRNAQYYTAWSHWLPRADVQFAQSRSRDFTILNSGALGNFATLFTPQAVSLTQWYLTVSMPIYQRSILVGIRQASAQKDVAENQYSLKLKELDWKLRLLLGNYLFQLYQEAALTTSIRLAETGLKEAKLRFSLGQKTVIDVLRAQANAAHFRSQKTAQERQNAAALGELLEYTGLNLAELQGTGIGEFTQTEEQLAQSIDQLTQWDTILPKLQPFLDAPFNPNWPDQKESIGLESQITHNSLTYKNALSEHELVRTQVKAISASHWPDLKIQGTLNRQTNNWNNTLSFEQPSYSLALVLTIPLFSGGSLWSQLSERKWAVQSSELKAEREILHLKTEIENERIGIRSSLQALEEQILILQQNEEIVRLSFKSYQLGKTTIVELLGGQQDLIRAKTTLARTKLDLSILLRQLALNLGVQLE
jgi:outer membrane protein TolC